MKHLIGRKIVKNVYLDVKNQRGQNVATPRTNAPVKVNRPAKHFWPPNYMQVGPSIGVIVSDNPTVIRATHELAGVRKKKTHWESNPGLPTGRHL